MPMSGNFANNPMIMRMLEEMRRRRQQQGEMGGFGPQPAPPQELGGMGGPQMGQRMGLGGMGRVSGGGNGMGMGFGGKPDMGGWGSGFKPSFGPPQEEIPVPDMNNGGWGAADSWDGPRQSMGQRDAPMPVGDGEWDTGPGDAWGNMPSMPTRDAPMPAPPMEMPQMGQRRAPDIMSLLGALNSLKRPKGRGGW